MDTLSELEKDLFIWPPVREMFRAGKKFTLVEDLDKIALKITKTARPKTKLLDATCKLPLTSDQRPHILKREQSESSNHYLSPFHVLQLKGPDVAQMAKGPIRWLWQDYVPYLLTMGEWRMFIIGGQPLLAIWTIKKIQGADLGIDQQWEDADMTGYYSLSEIK